NQSHTRRSADLASSEGTYSPNREATSAATFVRQSTTVPNMSKTRASTEPNPVTMTSLYRRRGPLAVCRKAGRLVLAVFGPPSQSLGIDWTVSGANQAGAEGPDRRVEHGRAGATDRNHGQHDPPLPQARSAHLARAD